MECIVKRILLFVTLPVIAIASHITVDSDVLSDTTWTADTVFVQSDINIESAAMLTISPGTKVLFSDHYKLSVNGAIYAIGNASDSILFTALDTSGFWDDYSQNTGGWSGIEFPEAQTQTDTSVFRYCIFQYAKATTNGDNSNGGAINSINTSEIIVEDCNFRNNTAYDGGGAIYVKNTGLSLSACKFSNNYAYRFSGGAIWSHANAELVVYNCNFENNHSNKGGAVYTLDVAYIEIDGCDFNENTATYNVGDNYGGTISIYRGPTFSTPMQAVIKNCLIQNSVSTTGAVYFEENVDAIVENNVLDGNLSGNNGAGIAHGSGCFLTIRNNIFKNNEANSGAAVDYKYYGIGLNLINNLFVNNYSRDDYASYTGFGGGAVSIQNDTDSIRIVNNTFANNRHDYMGGALHLRSARNTQLYNNIFFNNSAPNAPQIVLNTKGVSNDSVMYPLMKYNCIQGGQDSIGVYRAYGSVQYDSIYRGIYENNISTNPEFVRPSTVAGIDSSGNILDWSLQGYSSCINNGNPLFTVDSIGVDYDLAGNLRIYMLDSLHVADIGAYEYQGISFTGINESKSNIPKAIQLFQNYPNPFNPTTIIKYVLPKSSKVKIEIFNVLGQQVAVLVNEFIAAGTHQIQFNAENLSSGIYYYSIQVGKFSDVHKMILLR